MLDANTDKLLQTGNDNRPDLSSEREPHRDKTITLGQEVISGLKSYSGVDTPTY
jgi:hypothetical protein